MSQVGPSGPVTLHTARSPWSRIKSSLFNSACLEWTISRMNPLIRVRSGRVCHGGYVRTHRSIGGANIHSFTNFQQFPHHPIEFLKEQLRGHDPDNPSSNLRDVPEAAAPSTPSLRNPKTEPTVWFLPTPTSLGDFHGQRSQSQSVEEDFPLDCHAPTPKSVAELFRTPRASVLEDVNSFAITLTQPPPLEPGGGEEGQEEEGGVVLGSPDDEFMYGGPSRSAPSPILEHPHFATPLGQLSRGSRSQESPLVDNGEMDPLNHEHIALSPLRPNDANTTAQLFHGIDNLSNWEPTPSIHSYLRQDRPLPTFDKTLGLWYDSNAGVESYQPEDNALYKEIGRVQASRVREEELQYGWELVGRFIRTSIWIGPAQLGKQINRLVSGVSFFAVTA